MVVMGRITSPYGVRGWVKIQPYTQKPDGLLGYRRWWMGSSPGWQETGVEGARVHGGVIVAKLQGCDDRDAAFALRGREIAVAREDLPVTGENEYYWTDLVGLRVWNLQGVDFGSIAELFETGANDVLVVQGERQRLIPFIDQVVREVDLAGGKMLVDWDADF